jgi:hypothetical protein
MAGKEDDKMAAESRRKKRNGKGTQKRERIKM